MRFYEKYLELCRCRGVSPSRAAQEAGLSKSTVSKWKADTDALPSYETLKALAAYFDVTTDVFISGSEDTSHKDELSEYLDMLRNRPECRILLSTARGASKDEVEENIRIIEAVRGVRK